MNLRQAIGIMGGFITFLGLFTPLFLSFSAFNSGSILGILLFFTSVNSVILALAERFKAVLILGIISVIIVTEEFIRISMRLNSIINEARAELSGNPFGGLAEAMLQNMEMKWGWIILLTGSLMVLISGLLKNNP